MTGHDDVSDLVERLWQTNRAKVLARLDEVLAAVDLLAAGRAADRTAAERQAHALAGALGTYSRPGSSLLKEVERTLAAGSGDREVLARHAEQLRALADDLARSG